MAKQIFNVPTDLIVEFVECLDENQLTNSNVGVTEEEEILIEVSYSREEREAILDLMELVEVSDE